MTWPLIHRVSAFFAALKRRLGFPNPAHTASEKARDISDTAIPMRPLHSPGVTPRLGLPDLTARALMYHNRNPKAARVYLDKHAQLRAICLGETP
jgi:hypothetical protein